MGSPRPGARQWTLTLHRATKSRGPARFLQKVLAWPLRACEVSQWRPRSSVVGVTRGTCGVGDNTSRDELFPEDVRVVRPRAPASGSSGTRARYCKPSCRQRAYEARLMARTIGDPQSSPRQPAADTSGAITDLVSRLEALATVSEETRSSVFGALESADEPDYATAYQALFAAVAMLGPAQSAESSLPGWDQRVELRLVLAQFDCRQAALTTCRLQISAGGPA